MDHKFSVSFAVIWACFVLASTGCKTAYRDPLLVAGAPSAVLIHKSPVMSGYAIDSIDEKPGPRGMVSRFEIAPGQHSVVVALNEGLYRAEKIRIDFEANAGETYSLNADGKILGGTWWAWILEDSTGKKFVGQPNRPIK